MIPLKLRKKMAENGSMLSCVHRSNNCSAKIEWEHCWLYAGKQIQEEWAIIPCCYFHHRGNGLDKDFNRYQSLVKAFKLLGSLDEIIKKYPKKNWKQEWEYLKNKYDSKN